MRHFPTVVLALMLLGTPSFGWELIKFPDSATARQQVGRHAVKITCQRGVPGIGFTYSDLDLRGDGFDRIDAVMLWVRLPDGRTDKWSIGVDQEGPALSGRYPANSRSLDFFGNAENLTVDSFPGSQQIFTTDMKGTGAARIAFRERCGF